MPEPVADFLALLRALSSARVEFAVVGGAAVVLHGGATATYDLDVVLPFTDVNCERLLAALRGLHPRLAHTPDKRPLLLTADELAQFQNLYLLTDAGRLDVLGSLPPVATAEEALRRSEWVQLEDVSVRVLSLELLIQVKAALGRPKDKQAELELRAIAEVRAAGTK